MPERQADKWILPISITNKDLLKSIALCTNTPMCDLVDTAIREYIDRLKEGDYKKNLAQMKIKRKEYLKIRKNIKDLQKMRSEYAKLIEELAIESSEEETLTR